MQSVFWIYGRASYMQKCPEKKKENVLSTSQMLGGVFIFNILLAVIKQPSIVEINPHSM